MRATQPVIVFSTWPPVLTFHYWGAWSVRIEDGWHRSEQRTACGILLDAHEWRDLPAPTYQEERPDAERHREFTSLRFDHATKIGRLCRKCARTLEVAA